MSGRPKPLPATLVHPVFTTAEARAAGVSVQRLRASDLVRLGRGLYTRKGYRVREKDIVLAYCRSDPAVAAWSLTAARAWGFPLPLAHQLWDSEELSTPVSLNSTAVRRRDAGVIRWSNVALVSDDVISAQGALLTSRVRTWRDLAPLLEQDDLTCIGDHLVREPRFVFEKRRHPFATVSHLRAVTEEYRGRGARRLQQAVAAVQVGSDSPAETILRLAILRAGLPAPAVNTFISADGLDLGQPDLSWPEFRVCVEHEGPSHLTREQQDRDIERGERRRNHGWLEVRTVAKDLHHSCRRALRRITEALRQHGWSA